MFLMRRELKQRLSESRAKRVWALPSVSCFDRRSNITNGAKIMTEIFGRYNIIANLSLRYPPTITLPLYTARAGV